ncbi:NIC-domain-containing protein [Hypomontagnella submonticulosa]|nr:NIC-domain-containing protein [Hypomontagnella submonticulosa]
MASPFGNLDSLTGGSLNPASAQAPQKSPFGAPFTTQTSQGGSLFGNSSASMQQPFSTLSGTAPTNTQQQPQQQTQSQTPMASMYGASTNQPQPGAGGLGLSLGGLGSLGASQANTNPTALPQGNTTGYFDSLLSKNKQVSEQSPLGDLPSLQLGLGDLRQRLRKLGPRADPVAHDKARYILAASGVEPAAAVRDLNDFDVRVGGRVERPVSSHATSDIDIDAYLSNIQKKTTLSMIADGLERSTRDFDNFLEDNITMEWEAQRKRIYEHFGIKTRDDSPAEGSSGAPGRESHAGFGRSRRTTKASRSTAPGIKASAFGRSNLQKSVIGTPSKIGAHQPEFTDVQDATGSPGALNGAASIDDRFVREKQGRLAERVQQLNQARIKKEPYAILNELAQIAGTSGDRHAQQLVDAYHAAMTIVGENPGAETFAGDATAKERQFKDKYLDLNEKSPGSVEMRKRILNGANSFLENKFFQEVESIIAKHPREANLGGRPDVISKIKAYVRLRQARKDLVPDNVELQQVDGEFVWAIVFYLLRSGKVAEAADYVKAQATTFRSIDRTFASYLLEYVSSPDRRLRRQLQERCNNEYNQRARNAPENSIDPYRMACYKIVGRCDVSNRSLDGLNTEIEDWIWLQFNLARENDKATEVAGESYGLQDLRASIREIGLKHFPKSPGDDDNGAFGMFFFLQILSGMFEQAIAYLYAFSYVDAIHFAIALEYYGLLRPADPWTTADSLLSHDTRSRPQLSFGRMLGYYTRDFRAADVAAAVDYLTLICLNADLEGEAGRQQAELCHVALRELILESREFSKLIGDIRPDGRRIKGLVEERASLIGLREEDDFVKTVTLQAARFADDNGRTTDAVLLYHLAGDYDSVVTIVSRALSEAISLEIGEDPMRLMPVKPRSDGKDPEAQPGSSLSLASIDDPVQLAMTMMSMYEKDAMFYTRIEDHNRVACHILLQMSEIKGLVEAGQWPEALDKIRSLEILPLDASGDPARIRHYAATFSALSQTVAINVPNLLMWTITCCIRQRERLMSGQFSGNEGTRRMMCDNLKQISIDLTTYTSQLRYRFPPHLHEALARASAD